MSEPDVSKLLTVQQAIEIIDAAAVSPREIELPLEQAAGFVLAQDIKADRDYPPFDKSLMDGFAIRCGDGLDELEVLGEIPAGTWPTRAIERGQTMAIMTGAPMPNGADGVVPVEDASRLSPTRVKIFKSTTPGRFIAKRGSDIASGATVLKRGTQLGPAQLAVAASVGAAVVRVFARPRAAVLATGDELVSISAAPQAAEIRNSNNIMLVALLRAMGCDVIDAGVARDDPKIIREAIVKATSNVDALFITGGMSMGEHDYVPRILLDLGADLRITKLRIKPGKPFVFGVWPGNQKFVFGLPGNPVSGFACVVRLASRLVARLAGGVPSENWITAPLTIALDANGPREFYQPAILNAHGISPLNWKGSADIFTLASANALLVRGENEPPQPVGTPGRVLPLANNNFPLTAQAVRG